jgi:hypothetical protein
MKTVCSIMLCALLMTMSFHVSADNALKVDIRVVCEKPSALLVSLENESSSPVKIEESLLPWNHFKVIRMEAHQIIKGKSKRLTGVSPVADYVRTLIIAPGQKMTGEIYLNRSFAYFDQANSSSDIFVFYRINEAMRTGTLSFSGGSGVVVVRKKGLFSEECPIQVQPSIWK